MRPEGFLVCGSSDRSHRCRTSNFARRRCRQATLVAACIVLLCPGCSKSSDEKTPSDEKTGAKSKETPSADAGKKKIDEVDTAKLPAVESSLMLDGGRVELPLPSGWVGGRRSKEILARIVPRGGADYPNIALYPPDELNNYERATADNVQDLVEYEREMIKKDNKHITGTVKPVEVGPYVYVEYSRDAKGSQGALLTILNLVTVIDSRRYVLELQDFTGTFKNNKDNLYAVAAALKTHAGSGPPAGSTPDTNVPPKEDALKPDGKPDAAKPATPAKPDAGASKAPGK